MDISQKILSDIIVFQKYAKFIPEINRRETWIEICERNMVMHIRKYPNIKEEIKQVYKEFVYTKKVLPSMRSMQFGGNPIELNNTRIFNCAYAPVDHPVIFAEAMQLLLGGTGFGYSVQYHHIENLPVIVGTNDTKRKRFLVGDSIEGWADAVKVLVKAYTCNKAEPEFDYRDIRPKGAILITAGGKAPGPDPLRICIEQLRSILRGAVGRKLSSIECHDMMCHIADAVLSGGIRRAAMISFFGKTDLDMLSCKVGSWWELNPQRGRANNSVVLDREAITEEEFKSIWQRIEDSGSGEPGVYFTNDVNILSNPCVEATLNPFQFCNLTELNVSDVVDQEDFNRRAKAAAFIGTLQAGYTNFHYLRSVWRETTEKEALLGVGMTGIASGAILKLNMSEAATEVVDENKRVAALIGINPAARTTLTKPSGTSSIVVGSSSGIHGWHNDYYIRRVRVGKNESLYKYMMDNFPSLIEDCKFKPHLEAVMSFPQKAPEGAIMRTESAVHLLNRVRKVSREWILPGHNSGKQRHNVSCTISVKPKEWEPVGEWMWKNRNDYNGIAVLPYDGGSYVQAPFTDCTKEEYDSLIVNLHDIDLSKVTETSDNTSHTLEASCAGGLCEAVAA
jgi:ribonucleoside-triphosphate reductase